MLRQLHSFPLSHHHFSFLFSPSIASFNNNPEYRQYSDSYSAQLHLPDHCGAGLTWQRALRKLNVNLDPASRPHIHRILPPYTMEYKLSAQLQGHESDVSLVFYCVTSLLTI